MLTDQQLIELVQRTDPVQTAEQLPPARRTAQELMAVAEEERAMRTVTPHEQTSTTTEPRRRLGPAVAFTAALMLMLAAIGSVAYFTRDGGGADDVGDAPGPSVTADQTDAEAPAGPDIPTPSIDATAPPPDAGAEGGVVSLYDGTWVANELEASAQLVEHTSIGYLAGGTGGLLISDDGVTWHPSLELPVELVDPQPADRREDEGPAYETYSIITAVAEFESRIYAFGTITTDAHTVEPTTRRQVWSTTDGATWIEAPLPETSFLAGPLSDAAAGNEAILAVASSTDCTNPGTEIVLSTDGSSWRSIAFAESGLEGIALSNVLADPGGFVGVGSTCGEPESDGFPNGRRTVYRSDDGAIWSAVPGVPFAGNEFPEYAAAVDGGTIYVGGTVFDGEQRAALWRSTDGGATFEPIGLPPQARESWSFVHDIVPTRRGLLVVTRLGGRDDPMRTVLAAGDDAASLVVIPDPDGLFLDAYPHDAAGFDDVVIVGERSDGFSAWTWSAD